MSKMVRKSNKSYLISSIFFVISVSTQITAQEISPAQKLFDQVITIIKENYHGSSKPDIDNIKSRYQAKLDKLCVDKPTICPADYTSDLLINAIIRELSDPHSFLISRDRLALDDRDLNDKTTAQLGLITVQIPSNSSLVVQHIREAGPAYQAGIQIGDIITEIDGRKPVISYSQADLEQKVARLKVSKPNGNTEEIDLTPLLLGPWLPQLQIGPDGVGIITVFQFRTVGKVAQRVHDLVAQAKKADVKALILDLRSCLGGTSTEMVGVLGAFLKQPEFVYEYKDHKFHMIYDKNSSTVVVKHSNSLEKIELIIKNPQFWSGPMAILTNNVTASAAEYTAFLLQHTNRSKIIGEATFGLLNTGTNVFELLDGSYLRLSTVVSMTKDGQIFPEKVQPDIYVVDMPEELAKGHDPVLEAALKELALEMK